MFIDSLQVADRIQLGSLLVATAAIAFTGWQQNRLFRAQLLRDRFEMYWQTFEPATDEMLRDFRLYPEDWMTRELFDSGYANDENAQRRYHTMSRVYEYLAFTYAMYGIHKVPDPIGDHWSELWTKSLTKSSKEFVTSTACTRSIIRSLRQRKLPRISIQQVMPLKKHLLSD